MLIIPKTLLETIPKITPKYVKLLEKLGLFTVEDLLFYFPFRYDDFSRTVALDEKFIGQTITVSGKVTRSKLNRIFRRRMSIVEITLQDENNIPLKAVWFNQPYLAELMPEGAELRLSGKLKKRGKFFSMANPAWEKDERDATNTGRLVPVYSETRGLTSKWLRWQIKPLLETAKKMEDPIPAETRKKLNLYDLHVALKEIHFPSSREKLARAQKRFAFQEMFLVQLKSLQAKKEWEGNNSVKIKFSEKLIKDFVAKLPFKLTNAQRKAAFEILKDLEKGRPMNRLLNGDVGSGKTAVAAIAALQAMSAGYQVTLMAPTEVLARQHYITFSKLFENYPINIALLTNAYKEIKNLKLPSEKTGQLSRDKLLDGIKTNAVSLVIGTHALIQKDIKFGNLALIIIDEQHRFGVIQRAALQHAVQTDTDLTQTNTELIYEDLTYKIRGCFFAIKKELGLGHKESIYQKALAEELQKNNLSFKKEVSIDIKYNNKKIGTYRPDFIIDNKIIVELKALPSIGRFEKQQIWHYLKGSDYNLALLINFGREDIEIERFIHTKNGPHKSASSSHKSVLVPHLLTMTATPIPRTLAIAFSGSLDISILDEMPKNRKKIITKIVPPNGREEVYNFIRKEVRSGRQIFVIFPLVEESKVLTELKAATAEHKNLSEIFPEFKIGLLHGRLKSAEKENVMQNFKDKKYDILVSTSVVEVGIDVPNATIMLIEGAERFGLAQLHQFRGRVGRSVHQSYCFLFGNSADNARLKALEETADGFKIAQKDLELRGPGQFFGTLQSGLPDISMENLGNVKLIQYSQAEAKNLLAIDPGLKNHKATAEALKKFSEKIHLE